jgi:formylglycine-generating enzyme required for sulfatase activity
VVNVKDRYANEHDLESKLWEEWDDGNTVHARVGSYPANPFGLHEVIGNIFEMCSGGYEFYRGSQDRVLRGTVSTVNRGGSFPAVAFASRSACRDVSSPSLTTVDLGLRPARALR